MNDVRTQTARQYRPDIDGLRAVAILSVVLYHAHVPFVSGGFTGVDIFFVICRLKHHNPLPRVPAQAATPVQQKNTPMQFLQASIRSLQSSGKQVIVFGDVPSFDTDPFAQLWTNRIPMRRTIATWIGAQSAGDTAPPSALSGSDDAQAASLLQDALASLPGVTNLDLKHSLCNTSRTCAYNKDGRMLYFDYQHLTPDGACYVLNDFHLAPAQE